MTEYEIEQKELDLFEYERKLKTKDIQLNILKDKLHAERHEINQDKKVNEFERTRLIALSEELHKVKNKLMSNNNK